MSGASLYYTVCLVGYFLAGTLFWQAKKNAHKIAIRKKPMELVHDFMIKDIDVTEINKMFRQTGIRITIYQYQLLRYILCLGSLVLNVGSAVAKGHQINYSTPIFLIIVFFLSAPEMKIFGFKSPFKYVLDALIEYNKQAKNIELYRAICQLKNLAITKADRPPGSAFILEQLKKFTKKIRPVMNQMQSMWSLGQKDEACEFFAKAIGTPEAESFASILRKIDVLNPIEMKQQMVMFQEVIRRKRETERIKNNEIKSYFIYVVVVICFTSIFVNFLVVSVFINLLNDLQTL